MSRQVPRFPPSNRPSRSPSGDQLCLGARWLPAIYRQQVWSHHRLQQPLHQHHGGFPWRRSPLTFRLHINTQSTHLPLPLPPSPPLPLFRPPQRARTLSFISHITVALETHFHRAYKWD